MLFGAFVVPKHCAASCKVGFQEGFRGQLTPVRLAAGSSESPGLKGGSKIR